MRPETEYLVSTHTQLARKGGIETGMLLRGMRRDGLDGEHP
jgi:hypothetical protein